MADRRQWISLISAMLASPGFEPRGYGAAVGMPTPAHLAVAEVGGVGYGQRLKVNRSTGQP